MKINGYEYTDAEIMDALKRKGYTILPFRTYHEMHIHGSSFQKEWFWTKCAVRGSELPNDDNIWSKVAEKEFEKRVVRPPLI